MDEREKSIKGVAIASTLLVLMAVPFMFINCVSVVALMFIPLVLEVSSFYDGYSMKRDLWIYWLFFLAMTVSFIISISFIMMSNMLKANHTDIHQRKSPKSYLCELVGNLLTLMSMVLIIGSITGLTAAFLLIASLENHHLFSESNLFHFALLIAGLLTVIAKKFIQNAAWWRKR